MSHVADPVLPPYEASRARTSPAPFFTRLRKPTSLRRRSRVPDLIGDKQICLDPWAGGLVGSRPEGKSIYQPAEDRPDSAGRRHLSSPSTRSVKRIVKAKG